jgi:hypothetical protein
MTPRFRPSRPVRFAAVTAAAFGLGVPAALALTSAPDRPKVDDSVVRPAEAEHGVEAEHQDEATTTTTAGDDTTTTAEDDANRDAAAVDDHPDATNDDPAKADDDQGEDENEAGEDVSGPCDEAEHANDPSCTGTATGGTTAQVTDDHDGSGTDDRSGTGSHHSGDTEDRSGSDSGRD